MATWDELVSYVRVRYEIMRQAEGELWFDLPTTRERHQRVAVRQVTGEDGHPWAQITSAVGYVEKIDLARCLARAQPILGDVDRHAIGGNVEERVAKGIGRHRPAVRRGHRALRLRSKIEPDRHRVVAPHVAGAVVIESKPVERPADAVEVARPDMRLDRWPQQFRIDAAILRLGESQIPVSRAQLRRPRIIRRRRQARLHVVDDANRGVGDVDADRIDRRTVREVDVMDGAMQRGDVGGCARAESPGEY